MRWPETGQGLWYFQSAELGVVRDRGVCGFTVVCKALGGFKGRARFRYTLKAAHYRDYFSFTRLMIVK